MPLIGRTTDHDILAGTAQADTLPGHDGGDRLEGGAGPLCWEHSDLWGVIQRACAAKLLSDGRSFCCITLVKSHPKIDDVEAAAGVEA